jgi:hypothetical protein
MQYAVDVPLEAMSSTSCISPIQVLNSFMSNSIASLPGTASS